MLYIHLQWPHTKLHLSAACIFGTHPITVAFMQQEDLFCVVKIKTHAASCKAPWLVLSPPCCCLARPALVFRPASSGIWSICCRWKTFRGRYDELEWTFSVNLDAKRNSESGLQPYIVSMAWLPDSASSSRLISATMNNSAKPLNPRY